MPLTWDFIEYWFASSGGGGQHQPEQGRNRASGLCVRPIIMRWLSEVLSKIVKLSGVASCRQGAS